MMHELLLLSFTTYLLYNIFDNFNDFSGLTFMLGLSLLRRFF